MRLQDNTTRNYSAASLSLCLLILFTPLATHSAVQPQTTQKPSLALPVLTITTIAFGILYKAFTKPTDKQALIKACYKNDLRAVQSLLQKKVDLGSDGPYGETPLMIAAANSNPEIITALLDAAANVDARSVIGETAFSQAVTRNYYYNNDSSKVIMQILLDRKSDINPVNTWYQETALMSTLVHSRDSSTLEFLLHSGADYATYRNRDGFTAEQLIKQIAKPRMLPALNQRKKDDKEKFSAELSGLFNEQNLVATTHGGILAAFYGLPNQD